MIYSLHTLPYKAIETATFGGGYSAVNQYITTTQTVANEKFAPVFLFIGQPQSFGKSFDSFGPPLSRS